MSRETRSIEDEALAFRETFSCSNINKSSGSDITFTNSD